MAELISFRRIDPKEMPWDTLSAFDGANIFQTRPWIDFLADYLQAEPVIAAVLSGGQIRGYFSGLITKKFGLRILGSPFRNWNTFFMGFNLFPAVSYRDVLQAFPKFAFEELKCQFLMIIDTNLNDDECLDLPYRVRKTKNYAFDLTRSETELFDAMENRYARRSIRRAEKKGVVIEETTDPEFAEQYYTQYKELIARKSLPPYYSLEFLRQMITQLLPTGNLLLLRAKNSEGVCIATHIDLIFNKVAVAWGAASLKQYFNLHPNELIYWYAMRKVKAMGAEVFRIGSSVKQFKERIGAYETYTMLLIKAKNPFYYFLLNDVISAFQRMKFWFRRYIG